MESDLAQQVAQSRLYAQMHATARLHVASAVLCQLVSWELSLEDPSELVDPARMPTLAGQARDLADHLLAALAQPPTVRPR